MWRTTSTPGCVGVGEEHRRAARTSPGSPLVRAMTMKNEAPSAPVMNALRPLSSQPPSTLAARVVSRDGSEPAPGAGSVMAKADRTLPRTSGLRNSARCCSGGDVIEQVDVALVGRVDVERDRTEQRVAPLPRRPAPGRSSTGPARHSRRVRGARAGPARAPRPGGWSRKASPPAASMSPSCSSSIGRTWVRTNSRCRGHESLYVLQCPSSVVRTSATGNDIYIYL